MRVVEGEVALPEAHGGLEVGDELLGGEEQGPKLDGPGGVGVCWEEGEEVEWLENGERQAVVQVGHQQRTRGRPHAHLPHQGLYRKNNKKKKGNEG